MIGLILRAVESLFAVSICAADREEKEGTMRGSMAVQMVRSFVRSFVRCVATTGVTSFVSRSRQLVLS
jgi:hypothetical protein